MIIEEIISEMMESITNSNDYELAQWEVSIVGALKLIEFRRDRLDNKIV